MAAVTPIEMDDSGGSGPVLVLLHGWPDSPALWDGVLPELVPSHRCLRVQLPGFPGSAETEGADFPELVARIEAALVELVGDQSVVFIGHDWGAVLTYLFAVTHPQRIRALVTMDVGGHLDFRGPGHAAFFASYQLWLIAALKIGRVAPSVGDRMARWMADKARAPRPAEVTAGMGYPYAYCWRAMLRRRYRKSFVRRFRPHHPMLYLHGTKKPFPFQSRWWLQMLAEREDGEVVAVRGGHWFMLDAPNEVVTALRSFLDGLPDA